MKYPNPIRIATRQSKLAIVQSEMIKQAVEERLRAIGEDITVELLPLLSTGDRITDRNLLEVGGKGLFTKEIEEALLRQEAHIAMHSLKDVPATMPDELHLAAVLPREDYRDALVSTTPVASLDDIPHAAKIGTSSPRRAAQLSLARPDFKIVNFRGNVPTRLEKLHAGTVDATILAVAGLTRLNLSEHISLAIPTEQMLPALGQGIVVMQCRKDDEAINSLLKSINHEISWQQTIAERAVLESIQGDCKTPLAGLAEISDDKMTVRGMILNSDGTKLKKAEATGFVHDAAALGHTVGQELKAAAADIWS